MPVPDYWPHVCECTDGCACSNDPGPAVFVVTRRDRGTMKVCSRCILPKDTLVQKLDVSRFKVKDMLDYDPMFLLEQMMDYAPEDNELEEG